jgi:hypothetical protein
LISIWKEKTMPTRNHKRDESSSEFEETPRFKPSTFTSTAAQKMKEAADYVGEKAERATHAIGTGMESAGGAIREKEPAQGMLHTIGENVADKLEQGGRYIEEQGLKGIGEDITNLIRRNPVPALLIGVGIGVLFARLIRR